MNTLFRYSLLAALILGGDATVAQQALRVKGSVSDSVAQKGLAYATVSLLRAKDSTLVAFGRADATGLFALKPVSAGHYLLSVSYGGYARLLRALADTAGSVDAGPLALVSVHALADVTVSGKRPPVTVSGDTLSFNTENYTTQPNAVVEDLLRKMPGVTIGADGSVKVNGQPIKRILVNGKEFFSGDIKTATQNLPADAVDQVQVFDKASDQAAFTGIDDGNSEKTINLKMKKNRNRSLFGKTTAGGGSLLGSNGATAASGAAAAPTRFDAQSNVNLFNNDEQASFLGMANNTNRQGFSINDVLNFTGALSRGLRNGGGMVIQNGGGDDSQVLPVTGLGQSQQGVADTYAGGLNYDNTWKGPGSDVNASYGASHIHLLTDRQDLSQNLLPGASFASADTVQAIKDITQQRASGMLDQRIDSFTSFKMTPVLTLLHVNSSSDTRSGTTGVLDTILNTGNVLTTQQAQATDFSDNVLLRRKFARSGRTLSANISFLYNNTQASGSQQSETIFAPPTLDSIQNQRYQKDALTKNAGVNLTYTEPIGKHSLLGVTGYVNGTWTQGQKTTYDFDGTSGKYDQYDSTLSNNFSSHYHYAGGGLSFRTIRGKWNLSLGVSAQEAVLSGAGTGFPGLQQRFADVLPNATLIYSPRRTRTLRANYTTYTTQPTIVQLQPVADVSNPLNITIGNPGLKRSYTHELTLNYFVVSPGTFRNFVAFVDAQITPDAIVSAAQVNPDGTQVVHPVNGSGVYSLLGDAHWSLPLGKYTRLEWPFTVTYGRSVSLLNGASNPVGNGSLGSGLSYFYDRDKVLSLRLYARATGNTETFSLEPSLNSRYVSETYGLDMTYYLPAGLHWRNDCSYIVSAGRSSGYNTAITLWNSYLGKYILAHQRGELKLSVFDVLGQNTGITRTTSQTGYVDQRYNVLGRYFLVSFTFNLNRSGGNAGPKMMINRIGG